MVSPPILSDGPVGSLSRHWSSRRRAPRSQARPAAARSRRRALAARLLRRRAPGRGRRRNVSGEAFDCLRCDRGSASPVGTDNTVLGTVQCRPRRKGRRHTRSAAPRLSSNPGPAPTAFGFPRPAGGAGGLGYQLARAGRHGAERPLFSFALCIFFGGHPAPLGE